MLNSCVFCTFVGTSFVETESQSTVEVAQMP